jgi:type IVB pilus formation R64 PilN family outer membrane protein
MKQANTLRIAFALAITLGLGGCATINGIHNAKKQAMKVGNQADEYVNSALAAAPPKPSGVRILNDQYVATTTVELAKKEDPALSCDMPYNSGKNGRTLLEIGQDITEHCGTPVRVTPDALALLDGAYTHATQGDAGASGPQAVSNPAAQIVPAPFATGGSSMGGFGMSSSGGTNRITIVWDRKLKPFLDTITARLGLSWKINKGVITIYYLETKTYTVLGIPADTSFASNVSSDSDSTSGVSGSSGTSGGGGGGGAGQGISGTSSSSQKVDVNVASNNIKDMQAAVQSMMTPGVGRMASSFGSITVTDTPDAQGPISAYIAEKNRANSMQVKFNIKILSVQLNRNSESAFNLSALYTNLARKYSVTIANGAQLASAATSAGVNILNGSTHWSGSAAVVDLLSQVGKVATVYDQPVTTLNMHAVPIKNVKSDMFVIGTTTTDLGGVSGGVQSSIQQATQTVGLSMQLFPYIPPKGDVVYLQFSMGLSDASPLTEVVSGTSTAQQTHTTSADINQSVKLRSGQTLMLMGYRQSNDALNQSGTGDEHFTLLGGGQSGDHTGRYLVVLITPVVQD